MTGNGSKNATRVFIFRFSSVFAFLLSALLLTACTSTTDKTPDKNDFKIIDGKTYLPLIEDLNIDISNFTVSDYSVVDAQESAGDFSLPFNKEINLAYENDIALFNVHITVTKTQEVDSPDLKPQIKDIVTELAPSYERLTGDSWEDGHEWIMPGAATKISADLNYQGHHLDIAIYAEHLPYNNNFELAKQFHETHKAKFEEILEKFSMG